jgi:hypothetical protein
VEVRDVALVIMLKLTDQQPADYGYVNAQPASLQLQTLYRENDGQRDEAIAKWRAWRSSNSLQGKTGRKNSSPKEAEIKTRPTGAGRERLHPMPLGEPH